MKIREVIFLMLILISLGLSAFNFYTQRQFVKDLNLANAIQQNTADIQKIVEFLKTPTNPANQK